MTAPPMPAAGRAILGDAAPRVERYAKLLAGAGVERGLLGPNEVPRIWERHLLNSAVIAELVPGPGCGAGAGSLVDLGSGAGLPGIVLAMLLPGTEVTLLEPALRRATFLEECVTELELGNARVVRARAEQMAGKIAADVVTARAVAPLDRLAALALGLLKPGGIVLAVKGAKAAAEIRDAEQALRRLGVRDVEVLTAGSGKVDPAATVVRLRAPMTVAAPGGRTGSGTARRD
jgi:16S rRNA (guanine527-N7)-methyltransferase